MVLGLTASSSATTTLPTGFADSLLVGGLDHPVGMGFLPDGRLLVVEQKSARVRLIVRGQLAADDPVLLVDDIQTAGPEQGLLGVAVDPGWPIRPYVYLHGDDVALGKVRVSRYTASGDVADSANGSFTLDAATRYDLVNDVPDNMPNHNGGTLRFGPDGMLYASFGEDDFACNAQDPSQLLGVLLRLDVSRLPPGPGAAPRALVAAPGNPFAADPDSNLRLVWAYGFRNPFRFHVDPPTNSIFVGDVGEAKWEEVDRIVGGGHNFGWPGYEGPDVGPFAAQCGTNPRGDAPIYAYDRSGFSAAIISAGVYRGVPGGIASFPAAYEGDYFFSDFYHSFLRRLKFNGLTWSIAAPVAGQPNATDWAQGFDEVSDYLTGPDGALWYCRQSFIFRDNTGEIRRVVAIADTTTPPPPPVGAIRFERPRPTPATIPVTFAFHVPAGSAVELSIYDVRGRLIRTVARGTYADDAQVSWDGLDDDGRRAPAGVYVARLSVGGTRLEHRLPLLR